MKASQKMFGSVEITDSIDTVEFDSDKEHFRATYDSTRDSTSLGVVAVVATALGKNPLALAPLQSVIETDALDDLTTESSDAQWGCDSISFTYEGFEVTVFGEGVIEVASIENA